VSFVNTLIFTDNNAFSLKIAAHIQSNNKSPNKVHVVDVAMRDSLSSLLQDSVWGGSHPSDICFLKKLLYFI
jgi:hypothetical protein